VIDAATAQALLDAFDKITHNEAAHVLSLDMLHEAAPDLARTVVALAAVVEIVAQSGGQTVSDELATAALRALGRAS
jgi:hypothetical protein